MKAKGTRVATVVFLMFSSLFCPLFLLQCSGKRQQKKIYIYICITHFVATLDEFKGEFRGGKSWMTGPRWAKPAEMLSKMQEHLKKKNA